MIKKLMFIALVLISFPLFADEYSLSWTPAETNEDGSPARQVKEFQLYVTTESGTKKIYTGLETEFKYTITEEDAIFHVYQVDNEDRRSITSFKILRVERYPSLPPTFNNP